MTNVTPALLGALLATGVLLLSVRARADAVPSPPEDCPRGANGQTGHSGTWCAPTTCTSTCVDSEVCQTQGLCIVSETYTPGGRRAVDEPVERLTRQVAVAACNAGEACADGSRCVVTRRCVKPTLADAFDPKNAGCGCTLARHTDAASGLGLALVGALALVGVRWKRRRGARAPRLTPSAR